MTLDETYARILMEIDEEKWEYAHRILQCLTVACHPLHAKELAEVLAVEIGTGGAPELNVDLRPADADEAVLSACSSLIVVVEVDSYSDSDSDGFPLYPYPYHRHHVRRVIQFSHFSVKEFLTSDRLATFSRNLSRYCISPGPSHTVLAQNCIGTLLSLGHPIDRNATQNFPLAEYAARNLVHHVQSGDVSPQVEDGLKYLFNPKEAPCLVAWISIYDMDKPWSGRSISDRLEQPSGTPLYYAALCGFLKVVEHLVIACLQDPNTKGGIHHTPLHVAVYEGHTEVAQFLLDHGAAVDDLDGWDSTLLHGASRWGHLHMAELLLDRGAVVDALDSKGAPPLHMAYHFLNFDMMKLLLERGANPNIRDSQETTLLFNAVQTMHIEVVKLLLSHRAGVSAPGKTSLHHDLQIFELGGLRKVLMIHGNTSLHFVAQYGSIKTMELLLRLGIGVDVRDKNDSTPLHGALQTGHVAAVEILLEWGADVNFRDKQDTSPLQRAIQSRNLEMVQLLLRFGADIHSRDYNNSTPLHATLQWGSITAAEMLLERGADVNAHDGQDISPLHRAVQSQNLEVVQLLLRFGVDIHARNFHNSTPLHAASHLGWVAAAEMLLERGADVNTRDEQDISPLHRAVQSRNLETVQLLVRFGADIYARDFNNSTPLHIASLEGSLGIVRALLEHAADGNCRDEQVTTPVHHGSQWERLLNARDADSRTALHLASFNGHFDVARLLVDHGADTDSRDNIDQTPFSVALERGHRKLARFLSGPEVEGHSNR
jgi:ankyrin repeat protein